MLNMTLLRSSQPVITTAEYLRLHNIPEELELSNGNWGREAYHLKPDKSGNYTTLAVIPNGHWVCSTFSNALCIDAQSASRYRTLKTPTE